MVGLIVGGVVIGTCIVLGSFLCAGRFSFLIAGYNTMPASEKAQWDEKRLCQSMGKIFIGSGIYMAILILLCYVGIVWVAIATIPVFVVVCIAWVIYVNKNPRFRCFQ